MTTTCRIFRLRRKSIFTFTTSRSTVEEKKLTYVYEGQIHVVDQSILYKKECLKVMVFTDDPKAMFFDQKELDEVSKLIGIFILYKL